MSIQPDESATTGAGPTIEQQSDCMAPPRTRGDIVVAGVTVHIVARDASEANADIDDEGHAWPVPDTLDPVSQLLWMQTLRSMH